MTAKQLSLSKHWKRLTPAADRQPPRACARQRIATRIGELHEEFTEAPLLAVMLVLSFHGLADGAMASGFTTDRWLAYLFAFGIDYMIWAGYRRIRQGYPLGWVLVVPGSFATVAFQTFLVGRDTTAQHFVPPILVVLGFFVMERVRRARMVAGVRDVGGGRLPIPGGLGRTDRPRQPDPVPDGLRPGHPLGPALDLVETDPAALEDALVEPAPSSQPVQPSGRPGLDATPRPVTRRAVTRRPADQVTPADLDRAVETYTATLGRAKAKRAAVLELRLAPWKVVEAELKARGVIGSNGVRVTANGAPVAANGNGTPANGNGGGQ